MGGQIVLSIIGGVLLFGFLVMLFCESTGGKVWSRPFGEVMVGLVGMVAAIGAMLVVVTVVGGS